MEIKRILFLILAFISVQWVFAQGMGINQWRTHLPMNICNSIDGNQDVIYASSAYGLIVYDRSENSINRLTRVNGLNDIDIVDIAFHPEKEILVVAYKNTNIDLIADNAIINIRAIIETSAVPPGEKQLNSISLIGDIAYLSCDFGIVLLDVVNEEIVDTYYLGPTGSHVGVNEVIKTDTAFIAVTKEGVYWASTENQNLSYYEAWNKFENIEFPEAEYNHIDSYNDMIFISKLDESYGGDTVLFYFNDIWMQNTELIEPNEISDLYATDDYLAIVTASQVQFYDENLLLFDKIYTYGNDRSSRPADIFVDQNDTIWLADRNYGLVQQIDTWNYEIYAPDGPATSNIFDLSSAGGDLWMVQGGMDGTWLNQWLPGTLYYFIEEKWGGISSAIAPELDEARDMVAVCVNPFDPETVFFGSWNKGLYEFNNGDFVNQYNSTNSSLEPAQGWDGTVYKVAGLTFDNDGNLWVSNSQCDNALSVRINDGTSSGEWYSFYIGSASIEKEVGKIVVDDMGQKWILSRRANTLIVFNDNNTIEDPSDDQYKTLSNASGNGNLFGTVYSFAIDHDGELWLGTDAGIGVIYSPENVFSDYSFDAQRILIPREDNDTLADILLENNKITAITIDGANKKWIGTENAGVFLISDDGLEEFHHFTTANSPLLSNTIIDIEINDVSGEVFFGTNKGIISFKGEATEIITTKEVYAYPNPVRPGYEGPIAINGLTLNADFKVTDISGNLVFEGRAEGSQAIWHGRTLDGRKVSPGVYLVFASDETGENTFVTKILFVN